MTVTKLKIHFHPPVQLGNQVATAVVSPTEGPWKGMELQATVERTPGRDAFRATFPLRYARFIDAVTPEHRIAREVEALILAMFVSEHPLARAGRRGC